MVSQNRIVLKIVYSSIVFLLLTSQFHFNQQTAIPTSTESSIIVEYADSVIDLGLNGSEGLDQIIGTVPPNIIVEYADSISNIDLNKSEELNQVLGGPSININTLNGIYYNGAPTMDVDFLDVTGLDAAVYKVDSYTPLGMDTSGWVQIFADHSSTSYSTNFAMDNTVWNSLNEGSHTVYFKSWDDSGNINDGSSRFWQFNKDTIGPTIEYISPTEKITNRESQIVAITTPSDLIWAELYVNGISQGTQTFDFQWAVILTEGSNNLTVNACDSLSNPTTRELFITLDTQPPYIIFDSPSTNLTNIVSQLVNVSSDGVSVELFVNDISQGSQTTDFYWTITLVEGTNNLTAIVFDEAGNNEIKTHVIELDTLAPAIHLNSPVNNAVISPSAIINLTISDSNLAIVFYNWDSNNNQSLSSPWDITPPTTEGWHWLSIYATDNAGEISAKYLKYYIDTKAPEIMVNPINDTLTTPKATIDLEVVDVSLSSVLFAWNSDSNHSLNFPWDLQAPTTEGYHWLHIYANDTFGHFTKQDFRWWINYNPEVILEAPTNNSILDITAIINLTVTDTNLEQTWYNWNSNNNQTLNNPWDVPTPNTEGYHWLNVYSNDTMGGITSESYLFYINTPPAILLVAHENNTYIEGNTYIELIISDLNLNTTLYHWNADNNQTLEYPWFIPTPEKEGWHWLHVYAIDNVGDENSSSFHFYINYAPSISIKNLVNNSVLLPKTTVNLTISDKNLDTVLFNWDGNMNESLGMQDFIGCPEEEGWHILTIIANDTYGFESVQTLSFLIDGSPPEIQILSPVNASEVQPGELIFFSVTDLSLKQVTGSWDGGSDFEITNQSSISIPRIAGSHYLTLIAYDQLGHNTSKIFVCMVNFTLDISIQRAPEMIYEGETVIIGIKLFNPYNVSLTLNASIFAPDDNVENLITEFTIPAEDSYLFNFSLSPKHASQHIVTIYFYSGEIMVHEEIIAFDVNPFIFHPIIIGIMIMFLIFALFFLGIMSKKLIYIPLQSRRRRFKSVVSILNRIVEDARLDEKKWITYNQLIISIQEDLRESTIIDTKLLDKAVKNLIKRKLVSEPIIYGGVKHLPTWIIAQSVDFQKLLKLAEIHAGLLDISLVIKELNWKPAEAEKILYWSSFESRYSKHFVEPDVWVFSHERRRAPIIKEILQIAEKNKGEFRRELLLRKYGDIIEIDQILQFLEDREIAKKQKTLDGLIWYFPAYSHD